MREDIIQIENRIIGCLLLDENLFDKAKLNANYFTQKETKDTFKTIKKLKLENKQIDIVSVLEENNSLKTDTLTKYMADIDTTTVFSSYVEKIFKNYQLNKLKKECMNIATKEDSYDSMMKRLSTIAEKAEIFNDNKGMDKIIDDWLKSIREPLKPLKTGINALDKKVIIENGDIVVLGARPSVGKTALALQITINLILSGKRVCFANMEMNEKQIIDRMVANIYEENLHDVRTRKFKDQKILSSIEKDIENLKTLPLDLIFGKYTLEEIMSSIRVLNRKETIDFIVVDYLQLMTSSSFKGGNRNQELAYISRQFKMLAQEINAPLLLLSQLSRNKENKDRRPIVMDLRDSGAIEQDADIILMLHNPVPTDKQIESRREKEQKRELLVEKQRQGEVNLALELFFYGANQIFESESNLRLKNGW